MGISERLLGKKQVSNGRPQVTAVDPPAALPGGEVWIVGSGLKPPELAQPRVVLGDVDLPLVIGSDELLIARVPDSAESSDLSVAINGSRSSGISVSVAQ